jgi:SAM-dependent methyltransferase
MSNDSGCCGPARATTTPSTTTVATGTTGTDQARDVIRAGYAQIARSGQWSGVASEPASSPCCAPAEEAAASECCSPDVDAAASPCCAPADDETASPCCAPAAEPSGGGGCCGGTTLTAEQVAKAVGYSAADLASLPSGANMGLSCGNPTALASLAPGEVVLDLGSGGGFDCFLAGPRVGASGRVIGVDMTADMLSRARTGLEHYRKASGLDNVEFRLGEIEHLPLADSSVDVVISNCVLNLSTDKAATWREIARVLKPGGRVAISDLALLRPLPDGVRADVEALVGCVAGAILVSEMRALAQAAGLAGVEITAKPDYVSTFEDAQDPLYRRIAQALPAGTTTSDFVTSVEVVARKPAA